MSASFRDDAQFPSRRFVWNSFSAILQVGLQSANDGSRFSLARPAYSFVALRDHQV
jgi:hypothetical protein